MSDRDTAQIHAPRWVTALDVVCLVTLALLMRSLLGNYRIFITEDIRLSLTSWPRLAAWLIGLLAVRHLAWRAVPWHVRVFEWMQAAWRWEPLRAAWGPFIASRLLVFIAAYVAVSAIGFDTPPPFRGMRNDLLDLYARWDAGWYVGIARAGYQDRFTPSRQNAIAFFPGFPLILRAVGILLHVNLWVAGIVVTIAGFLAALVYVYRLARLDLPPVQARTSVLLLAFYPFAFCYSAILTEGLFLLAATGAFYHFRRREWWQAAFFGLTAGLLRPNGFLLSVPLGLVALTLFARSRGWIRGGVSPGPAPGWPAFLGQLATAAAPVAGMLAYALYVRSLLGNPFAWVEAQQAWGRETALLFALIDARADMIASQGVLSYTRMFTAEVVEAAAAVFALCAVWPIVRRFGLAYGVFVALSVIPPLVSMGPVSLGRYTAPLFPIFLWLAAAVPDERRPYWIAAFAGGLTLLSALFFTWRPPY